MEHITEACSAKNHTLVSGLIKDISAPILSDLLKHNCCECLLIYINFKQISICVVHHTLLLIHSDISLKVYEALLDLYPKLSRNRLNEEYLVHTAIRKKNMDLLRLLIAKDPNVLQQEVWKPRRRIGLLRFTLDLRHMKMLAFLLEAENRQYLAVKDIEKTFMKMCGIEWRTFPKKVFGLLLDSVPPMILIGGLKECIWNEECVENFKFLVAKSPEMVNQMTYMQALQAPIVHHLAMLGAEDYLDHVLTVYPEQVDLQVVNPDQKTLFMLMLERNINLSLIRKIVDLDASVLDQIEQRTGNTALHCASMSGNPDLVRFLLYERGVDPLKENFEGDNALIHGATMDPPVDCLIQEILAPYMINHSDLARYPPFEKLFALFKSACRSNSSFVFHLCLATFYGPTCNAMYPLLERTRRYFNLDSLILTGQHGFPFFARLLLPPLHNQVTREMVQRHYNYTDEAFTLFRIFREQYRIFKSDEETEMYFRLVAAHVKVVADPFYYAWDVALPPLEFQTPEVAARIYRVLTRIFTTESIDLIIVKECIAGKSPLAGTKLYESGILAVLMAFFLPPAVTNHHWESLNLQTPEFQDEVVEGRQEFLDRLVFYPKGTLSFLLRNKLVPVPSLKHLSRTVIRDHLQKQTDSDQMEFIRQIDGFPIPPLMKKYLRFIDKVSVF